MFFYPVLNYVAVMDLQVIQDQEHFFIGILDGMPQRRKELYLLPFCLHSVQSEFFLWRQKGLENCDLLMTLRFLHNIE
jgi:hypothetical protein